MALIDTAITRIGLGGSVPNYTRPFTAKSPTVVVVITGNIIFGQHYYMIHPSGETLLRPTSTTEFTIRKRDKKPIISGGDH